MLAGALIQMKKFLFSLWEIFEVGLIALVSVFVVRTFLVQPFLVSGASMEPTFASGDYLLIDEISYRFREPERGEVVVFRYPGNESVFYIKRILGLPGERLAFSDEGIKVFNSGHPEGMLLKEYYLPDGLKTSGTEVTLNQNEYFVLGDNRYFSFDSRSWGNLNEKEIIGLVRLRLWPLNKVSAMERPAY